MPTVTMRSDLMRLAFDTLPMGSPWACTFTSGCEASNSFWVRFSMRLNAVDDFESKERKAGAR